MHTPLRVHTAVLLSATNMHKHILLHARKQEARRRSKAHDTAIIIISRPILRSPRLGPRCLIKMANSLLLKQELSQLINIMYPERVK